MKTIFLIPFIAGFFAASAFSQDKLSLNLDTTGIDLSTYTDWGKYYQESQQHPITIPTLTGLNHLLKEKAKADGTGNAQNSLDILQNNKSYGNMPCVTPLLTDAMPVLKPDSTIRFRLRVKMMK